MTEKKTAPKSTNGPKPNPKIGQDAFFRKGGYEPVKTAPSNPPLPSKPGTAAKPAKSTSKND